MNICVLFNYLVTQSPFVYVYYCTYRKATQNDIMHAAHMTAGQFKKKGGLSYYTLIAITGICFIKYLHNTHIFTT